MPQVEQPLTLPSASALTQELLERCRKRAPQYDRDNTFCQEDFDELKAAGYLDMALPTQFGGQGLTLAGVARETRTLARYAPATALCINMHNYWLGIAADLLRGGDRSLEWLLREAAAGEVFAAGHAEHGNDVPGLLSTTKAERVDGGYKLTGRKAFGSLSPVWTRMGLHAMDTSDPSPPKIVHAFLPRDTPGVSIKESWDVLGMRATRSDDTVLDGAFVPDKYSRPRRAGRSRGRRHVRRRVLHLGARQLRQYLLCDRAADPRRADRAAERQDVDRAVAADDLSPGSAARDRGDHHGPRNHGAARRGRRQRLDEEAGTGPTGSCASSPSSTERWKRRFASSIARSISRAASACSRRASWSGCFATAAPAVSIRPIRR